MSLSGLGYKTIHKIDLNLESITYTFDENKMVLDRAEKSGSATIIDTLRLWSKGRIMLMGDSAHCLSLIPGQGACMALASAELLSIELTNTKDIA
ncbi:unnamed protein product [Clonostachys rosea]|uniref:FAD-binding domain-containing protein n=1 Tax=Bionectria ochroleuca TaxID=29856 RepID=A0ABY6TW80_BIOOC|nr:unnamed protein product [Clonostachys rosea]